MGQKQAYLQLMSLGVDGIQLTPGNKPDGLDVLTLPNVSYHHGFTFRSKRQKVWDTDGTCLVENQTVHPPDFIKEAVNKYTWFNYINEHPEIVLETMYPARGSDYPLSDSNSLNWAMDNNRPLAVDISHLKIQKELDNKTLNRLLNYDNIREIHVSDNNGQHDSHIAICDNTYLLSWAKERPEVKVLECYMHRMSEQEREKQICILRS